MADIRIAAESVRFAESFVKMGIVAGDGGAWLLPRCVGYQKASEMALTGDMIDATEASASRAALRNEDRMLTLAGRTHALWAAQSFLRRGDATDTLTAERHLGVLLELALSEPHDAVSDAAVAAMAEEGYTVRRPARRLERHGGPRDHDRGRRGIVGCRPDAHHHLAGRMCPPGTTATAGLSPHHTPHEGADGRPAGAKCLI